MKLLTDIFIIRFAIVLNLILGFIAIPRAFSYQILPLGITYSIGLSIIFFCFIASFIQINNKIIQKGIAILLIISGFLTTSPGFFAIFAGGILLAKINNRPRTPKQMLIGFGFALFMIILPICFSLITQKLNETKRTTYFQNIYSTISEKDRQTISLKEIQQVSDSIYLCKKQKEIKTSNNSIATNDSFASCLEKGIKQSSISIEKATIIAKAMVANEPKKE
jgi:hypothetical protein